MVSKKMRTGLIGLAVSTGLAMAVSARATTYSYFYTAGQNSYTVAPGSNVTVNLGGHPVAFFWHGGGTAGFYAYIVGYTGTGQGAAILANGKKSGELIQIVIHSIAKEYGWGHNR